MQIDVLEETDDKLKIRVHDNITLVNLVNENLWQQKIELAAVTVDHPYLSKPVLTIKSKKARKALLDATEKIIDDVKDLRKKTSKL